MSLYDIKLQRVEDIVISKCKEVITEHNNSQYFDMWISIDACCEIPSIYEDEFKNEYINYIDTNDSIFVQSCGSNLVYHIETIRNMQPEIPLDKLLKYIELFIKAQFDNFSNTWDNIQMKMSGIEREIEIVIPIIQNQLSEDNPSNT